jgi:hypothetical protein
MGDVAITKSKSITIRGGQIPSSPVIPETPEDPVTIPPTPPHNNLSGLQGGTSTERYHIDKDQWDAVDGANAPDAGNPFATMADVGGSGIPPIDGSYASEAAMIADQVNQTAQYIYFDGTSYWEYLGTTTPSIADYRQISGGGSFDGNPSSLNQQGATDGQAIIWNNTASEWQPTTIASASKWTDTTGGIYRDGAVTIGGTSLPSAGVSEFQTFSVQSKVTGIGGNDLFATFLNNSGNPLIRFRTVAPSLQLLPYSVNEAVTIGNISGFAGSRGIIIRPNSTGGSIYCTNTAGTTLTFRVDDNGALWNANVASLGNVTVGTTLNAWGVGIRGFGANNSSRMNLIVQRSGGTLDFQVRSNGWIDMPNLPTASTGVAGVLWNDGGTLRIG